MKSARSSRKRTAASLVALAVMMMTAGQAATVEAEAALNAKDVKGLVVNAKTAADHLKLARHYNAQAAKHEADANEHEALAAEYRRKPTASESKRPMAPDTAAHCDYYAERCRKAAKEMRAMASAHEGMAKTAAQ